MKTPTEIQLDFDRIALADGDEGWNHNNHYHGYLLRHVPPRLSRALEIGCGKGEFARLLARRADHVLGLDLSPEMLRSARESSLKFPNIDYVQADVMTVDLPVDYFDVIASIATLHHLALAEVLPRLKTALRPGGILLILDLYRAQSVSDWLISAAGVPINQLLSRLKAAHQAHSAEAQAAWQAHGKDDVYPTPAEVRATCADFLPSARVTRHLLWRYSLIWTKPL